MKKVKWVLLLSLALLLLAGSAAAGENVIEGDINRAAGSLEILRDTTVNGNVTLNMGEVVILGRVNGNVNSNMGQVTVHGEVNGDVEANMGQVLITGSVNGNVVARMGEVIVDGDVGGDVQSDLGAVRVRGTVAGNVESGLGEVRIPGEVLGNVASRGKRVSITGTVRGDVHLTRGIVELGSKSKVGGRVYVEQGMVDAAEGARAGSIEVAEELSKAEIDRMFRSEGFRFRGLDDFEGIGDILATLLSRFGRAFDNIRVWPWTWKVYPSLYLHFGWPGYLARGLLNMVVLFALAALTFSLFPRQVQSAGEVLLTRPGAVIGWGLLAPVLAVPLGIFLAITIIGIPLIIVEILLLALAGILGYTGLSWLVGGKIIGAASAGPINPLGTMAIGVLILGAISMIPLAGVLFSLVIFVLAVGAALSTRFGTLNPTPTGGPPAPTENEI